MLLSRCARCLILKRVSWAAKPLEALVLTVPGNLWREEVLASKTLSVNDNLHDFH